MGIPALRKVDLARVICKHLHGEQHSLAHRMIAGFAIMASGVGLAKMGAETHHLSFLLAFWLDLVGYLIHGVGAIPFIEWLVEHSDEA